MRRLLSLIVLAASVPLLASETAVSPPVLVPATSADIAAVASDGDDVLVVWSEIGLRIRYAIVSRGTPGDVPAKLLALRATRANVFPDLVPAAAFAGDRWLIVWSDYSHTRIEAALLDRGGNVLRRMTLSEHGWDPVVVAANGCFLVAWTKFSRGAGVVLSAAGDILSAMTFPFEVVAACESAGAFAIAGMSIEPFRCARECQVREHVARVAIDGRITAQTDFDGAQEFFVPDFSMVSGSDGGLLITSNSWLNFSTRPAGVLLDFALHRIADFDFGEPSLGSVTAAWDGSHYVVITNPQRGLSVTRVGIDKKPQVVGEEAICVLRTRGGWWLVNGSSWGGRPISLSFRTDLVDHSNEQRWQFLVVEDQALQSIATDGHSVLAGWFSFSGLHNALVSDGGARALSDNRTLPVTFDGAEFLSMDGRRARFTSVDGARVEDVSFDDRLFDVGSFSFLWNGSIFFAFGDDFDTDKQQALGVRRVQRSGKVIDRKPFLLFYPANEVGSMATNGRDAFVLIDGIYLGRVTPDGVVTILPCALRLGSAKIVAGDDTVYIVGKPYRENAVAIGLFGTSLRARFPDAIQLADRGGDTADVAAAGHDAVVVWSEETRIAGARVTSLGNTTPFVVTEGSDPVAAPRVAWYGGVTAIAYERLVRDAPYQGARRIFVQFFPTPPPRRAAGR